MDDLSPADLATGKKVSTGSARDMQGIPVHAVITTRCTPPW
jgi:hypothetical protein